MPRTPTHDERHGERVRDVRGRHVSVVDPARLHLLRRHDVIERDTLDRIVREMSPGAGSARAVAIGLALLAVGGLTAAVLYLKSRPSLPDLGAALANPAILAACAGGLVSVWVAARQTRGRRPPALLLRHRCCPHCGYSLRGLSVDPVDGATVCPECACAWRLDVPDHLGVATGPDAPRKAIILVVIGLLVTAALGLVMLLRTM